MLGQVRESHHRRSWYGRLPISPVPTNPSLGNFTKFTSHHRTTYPLSSSYRGKFSLAIAANSILLFAWSTAYCRHKCPIHCWKSNSSFKWCFTFFFFVEQFSLIFVGKTFVSQKAIEQKHKSQQIFLHRIRVITSGALECWNDLFGGFRLHTISRFAIFVSFHRIENYVCRSMTLHRLNKIVFIHNIFSRATCCHCRHCRRYCCQLCVSPPMCCERFFFVCFFSHSIGVNKSERERRKKRNETRREKKIAMEKLLSDGRMVGTSTNF